MSADSDQAVVSLVPEGALLLAGDAVSLDVRVGAGARLHVLEPSGTVAYAMAGGRASWDVSIVLDPAATLVWAGEPFVVSEGATVTRRTTVSMCWGARLALLETVVLGRHGEGPGTIRQDLEVTGPNDVPVLSEALHLGAAASPLLLGSSRALSTVLLLGERLPDLGEGTWLDLDAHGTMVRGLAEQAHLALPSRTWRAARNLAAPHQPGALSGVLP